MHGTTAALALLNDAVKKGGVMASSHVGGLSGAFIPVSVITSYSIHYTKLYEVYEIIPFASVLDLYRRRHTWRSDRLAKRHVLRARSLRHWWSVRVVSCVR